MATGSAAFTAWAEQLTPKLLAARPPPPAAPLDAARALVATLVKSLVSCVAMGAAMPKDGKHRQHLSKWLEWHAAGAARKSLQLDCAGLTLAVLCLARTLQGPFPELAAVSLTVRLPPAGQDLTPASAVDLPPVARMSRRPVERRPHGALASPSRSDARRGGQSHAGLTVRLSRAGLTPSATRCACLPPV